jgi:hypothetical protein
MSARVLYVLLSSLQVERYCANLILLVLSAAANGRFVGNFYLGAS